MQTITNAERRRRLAGRHLLTPGGRTDDVAALTDGLVALHSSDPATVYLSALVRMATPSIEAVEAALYDERSIIRHHAMRRTMWVMTPDVARLAHAAATVSIARTERRKNLRALQEAPDIGDAEAWLGKATTEILDLLGAEGPLTTRSIGKALPHLTIPLWYGSRGAGAGLKAHTKVIQGAGFDGLVMRGRPGGTWISSEYPWSTTQDWLHAPLVGGDPGACGARLLAHWLHRFGPATELDICWWFGWGKTLARQALGDISAVEVRLEGGEAAWVIAGDEDHTPGFDPWVRLLPGLDPTAMGWKLRDWYLDPAHIARLFDQHGNVGPTIWADGRIIGGWAQRDDASIALDLLEPLRSDQASLLREAVGELTSALGGVTVRPRFAPRNYTTLRSSR